MLTKIISHLNDEIEACGDAEINCRPIDYGTYLGLKSSKSLIEIAETADVVEVVRCKDCKCCEKFVDDFGVAKYFCVYFCGSQETIPDGYCHRGRKNENDVYFSSEEGAKRAIHEVVEPFMEEHLEFVW